MLTLDDHIKLKDNPYYQMIVSRSIYEHFENLKKAREIHEIQQNEKPGQFTT